MGHILNMNVLTHLSDFVHKATFLSDCFFQSLLFNSSHISDIVSSFCADIKPLLKYGGSMVNKLIKLLMFNISRMLNSRYNI